MKAERRDARAESARPSFRSSASTTCARRFAKAIVGNREVVDGVITCMLAGGHALLEGVPGLGKTMLVRTLAETLSLQFSRIQFTPDLMPADILGHDGHRRDAGRRQGVRVPQGPGLREHRPRRRDQPRDAQDAERPARGDAGAPRDASASRPTRSTSRSSCSRRRTRSRWRGRTRCPRRSSTGSSSSCTCPFPTATSCTQILDRTTGGGIERAQARARPRAPSSRCRGSFGRSPSRATCRTTPSAWCRRRTPTAPTRRRSCKRFVRFGSSPARRAGGAAGRRRSARSSTGASRRASTTCARRRLPALRHRVLLNFEGEAEGVKTDQVLDAILKSLPERQGRAGPRRGRPRRWLDAWASSTLSRRVAARARRPPGRRALRRRVPAQARVPRARQPARVLRGACAPSGARRRAAAASSSPTTATTSPGDDFRYLDWNVYQRFDRLLVRLYEEEEDLAIYFIVDASASMGFGGGRQAPLREARRARRSPTWAWRTSIA